MQQSHTSISLTKATPKGERCCVIPVQGMGVNDGLILPK